jgi:TolB-like protein/DNA-binding winged helix-turn-helix (wHTH) protein
VADGKTFSLAVVVPDGLGPDAPALADELRLTTGRTLFVAPSAATDGPAGDNRLLVEVADALRPEPEAPPQPVLRFDGYTLDLDGHALTGPGGTPIPLTPGEFALLREFVRRPGRVFSREQLGQVLSGRGAEPYERGIDMLVARLRRKIEPDPKHPRLVVTVQRAGYKFAARPRPVGPAEEPGATAETPVHRGPEPEGEAQTAVGIPVRTEHAARPDAWQRGHHLRPAAWVAAAALAAALGGAWWTRPGPSSPAGPSGVAVPPFANLSGDPGLEYVGPGVAADIATVLSTFPAIRVASTSGLLPGGGGTVREIARATSAQYVLEGGVLKTPDKIRITAQLIDAARGESVWASRYDESGADPVALEEGVADKIYDSLAGLTGQVHQDQERGAWAKSSPGLTEYDFYLRGAAFYFRFDAEGNAGGRQIWQEGLKAFPNSALLRTKLAWTYEQDVVGRRSDDPARDIERAWTLGREAEAIPDKSRHAAWVNHWLMAYLHEWHGGDFDRAVAEAEATVQMVPYDALSRAGLSFYVANAGKFDEAIEWVSWALRHEPHPPAWWEANLAWAYYLAGRYQEALAPLHDKGGQFPQRLAAIHVRLGRLDEARAILGEWLRANPRASIATEAVYWPMREDLKRAFFDDLRDAGLPER